MRILVYGAGVQGCELAHRLLKNKKNVVTLLARGEWKKALEEKGLVIRHWAQCSTTVDRVQLTDTLAPQDCYDLIFVAVQASQLADVLPVIKANCSPYVVFLGNQPHARSVVQAMQRPADKVAFGFQNSGGRRENGRVVSVHAKIGMTVGGATAPLSGVFRQRLQTAFDGVGYKLNFYGDMDEWLKCHLAFILPVVYVTYACGGALEKSTAQQRESILDAAWECCAMLKAAGVPVNDAEATDWYAPDKPGRRRMRWMLRLMAKTPLGRLCASDHAMHAVGEMHYLDDAFAAIRAQTTVQMPQWDALRAAMPAWETL